MLFSLLSICSQELNLRRWLIVECLLCIKHVEKVRTNTINICCPQPSIIRIMLFIISGSLSKTTVFASRKRMSVPPMSPHCFFHSVTRLWGAWLLVHRHSHTSFTVIKLHVTACRLCIRGHDNSNVEPIGFMVGGRWFNMDGVVVADQDMLWFGRSCRDIIVMLVETGEFFLQDG